MYIQIQGLYDGTAVIFDTETKEFSWLEHIMDKTTEKFREEFETEILKVYEDK